MLVAQKVQGDLECGLGAPRDELQLVAGRALGGKSEALAVLALDVGERAGDAVVVVSAVDLVGDDDEHGMLLSR